MKKISLLIALSLLSFGVFAKNIRIGSEGYYPPLNMLDKDGNLIGFEIELANAVCKELNYSCTFVQQDWEGIIPALQAKKFDMIIAGMSITPERKKVVDFSDSYLTTPSKVLVNKNFKGKFTDLAKKRVGVQTGTLQSDWTEQNMLNAKIKYYDTNINAISDLSSGRVDAVIIDSVVSQDIMMKNPKIKIKYLDNFTITNDGAGGMGVAVRKGDSLAKDFNKGLKMIKANGEYDELLKKYNFK